MRTSIMLGGPSSGENDSPEPVYLLTRKRVSSIPPPPAPDYAGTAAHDDIVAKRDAVRATVRRRSMRFVGVLGLGLALSGIVGVLKYPEARREVLSWVTMGHPDQAAQVGRRMESLVAWLRQR